MQGKKWKVAVASFMMTAMMVCALPAQFLSGLCKDSLVVHADESAPACVEIGTDSANKDIIEFIPVHGYYNYGYTEQIYTAEEMGNADMDIIALSFFVQYNNFAMTGEIYLYDTQISSFNDPADLIPLSAATLVYQGDLAFDQAGWVTLEFNKNTFQHKKDHNLVVITINTTGSYSGAYSYFSVYEGQVACTAYDYNDNGRREPNPDGSSVDRVSRKNCIRFYSDLEKSSLIYDTNGGVGENTVIPVIPGEKITAIENSFSHDDALFAGWNTKPDGTGTRYNPGDLITTSRDMTLYAEWGEKIKVTYAANDGSYRSVEKQDKIANEPFQLDKNIFNREKYEFIGWNTDPDGNGDSYSDGQTAQFASSITLYAQWKECDYYTVGWIEDVDNSLPIITLYNYSYTEQIYTADEIGDVSWIEGISFMLNDDIENPRTGSIYLMDTDKEWFDNKTDVFRTDDAVKVFDGRFPFEDAGWTRIDFDVPFCHNPQKNLVVITIDRSGYYIGDYVFFGVYEGQSRCSKYVCTDSGELIPGENEEQYSYSYKLGIENNKNTLRIHPLENAVTAVTFNANGSGETDICYAIPSDGLTIKDIRFTYDGHVFTGWNTEADGSGDSYVAGDIIYSSEDMVLYAQWDDVATIWYNANHV